ncbi:MAG TPA: M20/M25/M40 family metallo-hydrolase [Gemmatimonadaceae bacterium]|nr:M20/M25/M40 family metallo-hydrolase [Gemmatimonadaceae bacterium]
MRPCLALFAIAAAAAPLSAQEPFDRAMVDRIKAEGMDPTRSRALATFSHLTNVIGPRLTGSPLHKQSADWAMRQLAEWGLSNTRLEAFPFGPGWTLDYMALEVTKPRYFPAYGYPQAWSPSTKGVLTRPLYLAEMTQPQIEALGERLRGAIILPSRPQTQFFRADRVQPADVDSAPIGAPRNPPAPGGVVTLAAMMPTLQKFGAGAILLPNSGEHGTAFVLGANPRSPGPDAIPRIVMVAEHYNTIVRLIESGAPVEMRVESKTTFHRADTSTYNVLAEIPGVDPALRDEIVLVGAHLDSWHSSAGATDNADASAAAMEAMRILKAVGARPRRTIRLGLWSGEEQGLLGARAHLARAFPDSASRSKLAVYLNDDPGTGNTLGWYMENNAAAKAIFDAWLEPLKDLGVRRNVIGAIGSTDHVPFVQAGLPAFTTIKDYAFYDYRSRHSNTDFYERVSPESLRQSATVLAIFAYNAAMRPERIPARSAR